jgi:hypothetical protein
MDNDVRANRPILVQGLADEFLTSENYLSGDPTYAYAVAYGGCQCSHCAPLTGYDGSSKLSFEKAAGVPGIGINSIGSGQPSVTTLDVQNKL